MNEEKKEKKEKEKQEKEYSPAIIDLVVERLKSLPSNVSIVVGDSDLKTKEYSRTEMIKNVKENTDFGKQIIKIQMDYIRSLKELTKQDNNVVYSNN